MQIANRQRAVVHHKYNAVAAQPALSEFSRKSTRMICFDATFFIRWRNWIWIDMMEVSYYQPRDLRSIVLYPQGGGFCHHGQQYLLVFYCN